MLSTRVRFARNIEGYAFSARAREGERLRVLSQVREALAESAGRRARRHRARRSTRAALIARCCTSDIS